MSDELRTAVLAAIAGDGATLVEIYERTGEDSRRTLAMLHVLAGQKIATCTREEGRGMVWSLTDEAAADAPEAAPAPAPTVRRIERAPSRSPRPAESNATVILRWIAAQQRPVLVREIIRGVGITQQSVYNTLTDLTRSGRVVKGGLPMRTTYSVPTVEKAAPPQPETRAPADACAPQPDTLQAIARALDKVAEAPAPASAPAPRTGEIVLQVSVPFDRASAVLRAIEQALA
jgi:DNA-binding transcriptional ArsR family regulator